MEVADLLTIPLDDTDLILLDLDNTLYGYEKCHHKALNSVVEKAARQLNITKEQATDLYMEGRKLTNTAYKGTAASHSRLFYFQVMVEKALQKTDSETINLLYKDYWDTYIHEMTLFPDAIPFLDSCLKRQIPIILVTDMIADVQFRKIEALKISPYVQYIVTSEEAGIEKPAAAIFEKAIEKALQIKKGIQKIAVVGDNPKKDFYLSPNHTVTTYNIIRNDTADTTG